MSRTTIALFTLTCGAFCLIVEKGSADECDPPINQGCPGGACVWPPFEYYNPCNLSQMEPECGCKGGQCSNAFFTIAHQSLTIRLVTGNGFQPGGCCAVLSPNWGKCVVTRTNACFTYYWCTNIFVGSSCAESGDCSYHAGTTQNIQGLWTNGFTCCQDAL